ncbi:MAG TPA: glycosyltransferase [Candidatus Polarisedimenticolia bacterium]|nr:glycosyltransferase [Candidatus Polarisedimenticolia bacterium]
MSAPHPLSPDPAPAPDPPPRPEGIAPRAVPGRGPRPRLLILTVGFTVGGAEQLILMTAPRLAREGFEVTVACLKGWGPLGDELDARGVRAVALGCARFWDLRAAGRLLSLLRRDRIQIVHAHLFSANLAARLLGWLAGVPVVISSHHDTDVRMGPGRRLVEHLTAPLSDAVIACSEAVRRYAIERYGLRPGLVRTLQNAIEIAASDDDPGGRERLRRELGAGPGDLLIGAVGRLDEPKKGLSVLLAAARILVREVPEIRLALVGDGPARALLERRAAQEGVSHRATFTGERRDIAAVMRALDLLVLPSIWEGFGLSLLEAMAAGLPVVASRVGGVPEVVVDGETGVLVPPGDPQALASACAALLRDRPRLERLGRAGRERVERLFRIERLVRETADLYRGLLPARRADRGSGRRG